jgi:hypothetical protein
MPKRKLRDLVSVGPAITRDFELLGVKSVAQLAKRNPEKLYERLCRVTGKPQDICCLDVFRAAVAQARNPALPNGAAPVVVLEPPANGAR